MQSTHSINNFLQSQHGILWRKVSKPHTCVSVCVYICYYYKNTHWDKNVYETIFEIYR